MLPAEVYLDYSLCLCRVIQHSVLMGLDSGTKLHGQSKRILREIRQYHKNPHPHAEIFPSEHRLDVKDFCKIL